MSSKDFTLHMKPETLVERYLEDPQGRELGLITIRETSPKKRDHRCPPDEIVGYLINGDVKEENVTEIKTYIPLLKAVAQYKKDPSPINKTNINNTLTEMIDDSTKESLRDKVQQYVVRQIEPKNEYREVIIERHLASMGITQHHAYGARRIAKLEEKIRGYEKTSGQSVQEARAPKPQPPTSTPRPGIQSA